MAESRNTSVNVPTQFLCSKCHWIMNNPVQGKCCLKSEYCFECYKSSRCCQGQDYILLSDLNKEIVKFQIEINGKVICYICDLVGEHETKYCPTITCITCNEIGHIQLVCPKYHKRKSNEIIDEASTVKKSKDIQSNENDKENFINNPNNTIITEKQVTHTETCQSNNKESKCAVDADDKKQNKWNCMWEKKTTTICDAKKSANVVGEDPIPTTSTAGEDIPQIESSLTNAKENKSSSGDNDNEISFTFRYPTDIRQESKSANKKQKKRIRVRPEKTTTHINTKKNPSDRDDEPIPTTSRTGEEETESVGDVDNNEIGIDELTLTTSRTGEDIPQIESCLTNVRETKSKTTDDDKEISCTSQHPNISTLVDIYQESKNANKEQKNRIHTKAKKTTKKLNSKNNPSDRDDEPIPTTSRTGAETESVADIDNNEIGLDELTLTTSRTGEDIPQIESCLTNVKANKSTSDDNGKETSCTSQHPTEIRQESKTSYKNQENTDYCTNIKNRKKKNAIAVLFLDITFVGCGYYFLQMVEIAIKAVGLNDDEESEFFRSINLDKSQKPWKNEVVDKIRAKGQSNRVSEKKAMGDFLAFCQNLVKPNRQIKIFVTDLERVWYPLLYIMEPYHSRK